MADFKVGRVTHYYDKIGVAVVELDDTLAVGDKIKFSRGGEDLFEQEVSSMQIEHEKVQEAKGGQTIGLKVEQQVRDGADVYKVGE